MTTKVCRVFAPAKINLALHVTGKREDGYHLLDSLVVFARDIGDKIEATTASDLTLAVTGPLSEGVPTDDSNLVMRAGRLLQGLRGVTSGAALTLEKHLPHGAGIGGGSSDAAAALKALADLWNVTPLTTTEALTLGADLPVCMTAPMPTRMSGIGEVLSPTANLPQLWLVLVNPGIHVDTGDIFTMLSEAYDTNSPALDPLPNALDTDSFALWLLEQQNDLTKCAAEIAPEIARIITTFWSTVDNIDSDMSGSGSTCWGLYESEADAQNAAAEMQQEFPDYWIRVSAIS